MAEQEQVAPKDDPPQDLSDTEPASAQDQGAEPAAETVEADPVDAETAETVEASTETAAAPEASERSPAGGSEPTDGSPETPTSEGGEEEVPAEPPEDPGFVSRILEEAVEEASETLKIPTGEEAALDVSDFEEPTRTVSPDELERTEDAQGFTGETYGQTVSLDELETEEHTPTDDPVYDQFRQVVDQTSIDVREQDIVEGRVLQVNEDYVVIDIGYKSDGIVPRDEFEGEDIRPGDTVEVYLERKEDQDGQLVLSKQEADKVRRWQRVEEIYESEEVVEGTIIRRIKGGMIVELFDGMEAFLPGSQIDVRPVRDFESYLEKRMEFKIVKLNPENENIVVSHREPLLGPRLAPERDCGARSGSGGRRS